MSFSGFILKLRKNTFVEASCGNEETIRKYVQDQLAELDQKEIHSDPLDLF